MIDLIKWCFKDCGSAFMTVLVIYIVLYGIVEIIGAIRKK